MGLFRCFLRGCVGSVRVVCFSIVRNECAVVNQSQTTNGLCSVRRSATTGGKPAQINMCLWACLLVVLAGVPGGCSMVVRQLSSVLSGCPVSGASGVRWARRRIRLNSPYYGDRQMVHESRPI